VSILCQNQFILCQRYSRPYIYNAGAVELAQVDTG
jgi:hypothetical protein